MATIIRSSTFKGGEIILKFLKSKIFIIFFSFFLIFNTLAFVGIFFALPEKITITKSETDGKWIPKSYSWLVSTKETDISYAMENTSHTVSDVAPDREYRTKVYFCGILPVKSVDVSVIGDMYVVPGGQAMGITLKTDGILCVGFSPFTNTNGKKVSPAKDAGMQTGDIIKKINGSSVEKVEKLTKIINSSSGDIYIEGIRNNTEMSWTVTPHTDKADNLHKIGLWIRESVAGIGTVSFYAGNHFAALGHPISDIDTGESVDANGGTVCHASIIGVQKGEKGSPGSLKGVFMGVETGNLTSNTYCGVFGTIKKAPREPKMMIASKNEVRPGKASLICDIGGGKPEQFDIQIIRLTSTGNDNKSMIIKVTDKKLLSKTGGIVQGMSGSPIVQNGKLVGAVTHVFVNDPTRGYGIFIENMLAEAEKIK